MNFHVGSVQNISGVLNERKPSPSAFTTPCAPNSGTIGEQPVLPVTRHPSYLSTGYSFLSSHGYYGNPSGTNGPQFMGGALMPSSILYPQIYSGILGNHQDIQHQRNSHSASLSIPIFSSDNQNLEQGESSTRITLFGNTSQNSFSDSTVWRPY